MGVPPTSSSPLNSFRLCASEPSFRSVTVSVPAPLSTIVDGSNEYSSATTRSFELAGAVTVRPESSSSPQPGTSSEQSARVRAKRRKASGYYAPP